MLTNPTTFILANFGTMFLLICILSAIVAVYLFFIKSPQGQSYWFSLQHSLVQWYSKLVLAYCIGLAIVVIVSLFFDSLLWLNLFPVAYAAEVHPLPAQLNENTLYISNVYVENPGAIIFPWSPAQGKLILNIPVTQMRSYFEGPVTNYSEIAVYLEQLLASGHAQDDSIIPDVHVLETSSSSNTALLKILESTGLSLQDLNQLILPDGDHSLITLANRAEEGKHLLVDTNIGHILIGQQDNIPTITLGPFLGRGSTDLHYFDILSTRYQALFPSQENIGNWTKISHSILSLSGPPIYLENETPLNYGRFNEFLGQPEPNHIIQKVYYQESRPISNEGLKWTSLFEGYFREFRAGPRNEDNT